MAEMVSLMRGRPEDMPTTDRKRLLALVDRQKELKEIMKNVDIAVIDIETSGLNPNEHIILEVGILLLTRDFEEIDSASWRVTDATAVAHLDWLERMAEEEANHRGQEPYAGARYVHEMHQRNELALEIHADIANGIEKTVAQVAVEAATWLEEHNISRKKNSLPMTGSTVHFDRGFIAAQMPKLNEQFHYRNIDISTLKNLVQIYAPNVAKAARNELDPQRLHRSLPDCWDSVGELKFYLEALSLISPVTAVN